MSQSNPSPSPSASRPERHPYFDYRRGSDGVDKTYEVYCVDTGCTVATFNYWEQRDHCRQWAGQLTAALNVLYDNGGHVRVSNFVTSHEHLVRKYCRDTIVHHETGEPLIAVFDDYEIYGVRVSADGEREYVADELAQFWSLSGYRYENDQVFGWIGDYLTREAAKDIYARITGWFYRPRWKPQAVSVDASAIHF